MHKCNENMAAIIWHWFVCCLTDKRIWKGGGVVAHSIEHRTMFNLYLLVTN
jgi:hypothetical protein